MKNKIRLIDGEGTIFDGHSAHIDPSKITSIFFQQNGKSGTFTLISVPDGSVRIEHELHIADSDDEHTYLNCQNIEFDDLKVILNILNNWFAEDELFLKQWGTK